jgi:ribosomal protein L12E/L44/L45/RPP1/RPP2
MTGPDDRAAPDTVHSRRAVLEGAAVAVVAAVAGFAWFSAAGPPSEEERDAEEDERDAEDDELEDRQDDLEDRLEDDDDSGPGGGDQS